MDRIVLDRTEAGDAIDHVVHSVAPLNGHYTMLGLACLCITDSVMSVSGGCHLLGGACTVCRRRRRMRCRCGECSFCPCLFQCQSFGGYPRCPTTAPCVRSFSVDSPLIFYSRLLITHSLFEFLRRYNQSSKDGQTHRRRSPVLSATDSHRGPLLIEAGSVCAQSAGPDASWE